MDIALALLTGLAYAAGIYLMLHRSFVKVIIGMSILGYATNMFLFVISRLTRSNPALVAEGQQAVTEPFADPVPQALILTAIVIGFGIQAFAVVLIKRAHQTLNTGDLDQLNKTDAVEKPGVAPVAADLSAEKIH
jgi:multicomponent Na+:H+ antiporter subunit C